MSYRGQEWGSSYQGAPWAPSASASHSYAYPPATQRDQPPARRPPSPSPYTSEDLQSQYFCPNLDPPPHTRGAPQYVPPQPMTGAAAVQRTLPSHTRRRNSISVSVRPAYNEDGYFTHSTTAFAEMSATDQSSHSGYNSGQQPPLQPTTAAPQQYYGFTEGNRSPSMTGSRGRGGGGQEYHQNYAPPALADRPPPEHSGYSLPSGCSSYQSQSSGPSRGPGYAPPLQPVAQQPRCSDVNRLPGFYSETCVKLGERVHVQPEAVPPLANEGYMPVTPHSSGNNTNGGGYMFNMNSASFSSSTSAMAASAPANTALPPQNHYVAHDSTGRGDTGYRSNEEGPPSVPLNQPRPWGGPQAYKGPPDYQPRPVPGSFNDLSNSVGSSSMGGSGGRWGGQRPQRSAVAQPPVPMPPAPVPMQSKAAPSYRPPPPSRPNPSGPYPYANAHS